MRQFVYSMFVVNNRASFRLCWTENLVKHQKVSNFLHFRKWDAIKKTSSKIFLSSKNEKKIHSDTFSERCYLYLGKQNFLASRLKEFLIFSQKKRFLLFGKWNFLKKERFRKEVSELKEEIKTSRKQNICTSGNVIALQIILRAFEGLHLS